MSPPMPPRELPPILFTFLGILFGLGCGLLFYLVFLLALDPGILTEGPWPLDTIHWYLLPGSFLGFLAFSAHAKVGIERRLQRSLASLSFLLLGLSVGITFGLLAHFVASIALFPELTVSEIASTLGDAAQDPSNPFRAFLVAGAAAGVTVVVYLRGGFVLKKSARFVAGSGVGALSGLVLYAFAYVLVYYPQVPSSSAYLAHFAEAIYSFSGIEFGFVAMGTAVGTLLARYSWRTYGIFAITALLSVVLGYLLYSLSATIPDVPAHERPFAYILFTAETVSLTMVVLYSFYTIDVATRKRWIRAPKMIKFSKYYVPKVAIQVPCYNEPADLVIDSLRTLLALDYPEDRFLLMVADDSTDPASSEPLRAFCERKGIGYYRRPDRAGYKAGALNYLLKFTPEDVDLIAVVDADYQVEPEFLHETVGYFIDPALAWIQTPQDYRNQNQSFLTKQYYLADKYFYRTVLPSRNEENSIIFCGTMGILRREALIAVGGWGEDYITEDAELSVRLLANGWQSLYVNKTYGRGLIPATFGGYKKQHARWAFGGGQVLRGHFADIFFGRFTGRQRFDYFLGNMHWFEGIFLLVIALSIVTMGVGEVLGYPVASHHAGEILLIGLVPWFLLIDGFTRLNMVLRRNLNLGFGGTIRVLGMWMAVKFSSSFSALKGFLGFKMPFIRTPKAPKERLTFAQALPRALRTTPFESMMATIHFVVGAAVTYEAWNWTQETGLVVLARWLLALWLWYYGLIFAAAPIYACKSYTTFAPDPAPVPASQSTRSVPQ